MEQNTHGSEEFIDYVVVHRALGQPRYTIKFHFIQLTIFEASVSVLSTVLLWWIIESLNLGARLAFGLISWDIMPVFVLITLPVAFSLVHLARPDLKIWETVSAAFVPTQFKDLADTKWKPSNRRRSSEVRKSLSSDSKATKGVLRK